jgi:hypothetical protein
MLRGTVILGAVLFWAAGAAAAPVPALDLLDAKVEYSADFYVRSDKHVYDGKVWHAPGKERRDIETAKGGQVLLLRRDLDQAIMLTPHNRTFVGLSFKAAGAFVGGLDGMMAERRRIGVSSVSGVPATRYEVTATSADGSRFTGDMWFTDDGIMMKAVGTVSHQGRDMMVETGLRRLKLGKVKDTLFDMPGGYSGLNLTGMKPDQMSQMLKVLQGQNSGR